MSRWPSVIAAAALAACLLLPAAADAARYAPPRGKVLQGGTGGYDAGHMRDFARRSGRRPAVYQFFFTPGWRGHDQRSLNWQRGLLRLAAEQHVRPMFALSTAEGGHGGSAVSPGGLASGAGDGYLIDLNGLAADSGQVLYVRLMAEMNNWNNPYSAFGPSGRFRGRAHSTRSFRNAWRRAALVLRGGPVAGINRRLRRLGLPPVRSDRVALPRPRLALQWVPFTAGLPNVRGNGPGAYWPGSRYVDWVGTDFFANSPNFRGLNRFYRDRRWRRKPFVFGEWALWGREDPRFVRRFFGWIRHHRRVGMVVYNQGSGLKRMLRLGSFPRSSRELRRQLRGPAFGFYPAELR
ncbi:MAG: hypothetical protein ABR581_02885 [Thermoleophilaceae bacterium]